MSTQANPEPRLTMQQLADSLGRHLVCLPPWGTATCWRSGRFIMVHYGGPKDKAHSLTRPQAEAYRAKLVAGLMFRHTDAAIHRPLENFQERRLENVTTATQQGNL